MEWSEVELHRPHQNTLFQCRGGSKRGLDQQWVKKDDSLSVLNTHVDIVDSLSLIEVAERFTAVQDKRRSEFETFTIKNLD